MANIIIKGKLIECRRTVKKYNNGHESKEKLFISVAEVALTEEQQKIIEDAFKDSGKKFTPAWVADFEGYVNTSTVYELPAILPTGRQVESIEDAVADGFNFLGADVYLSLNVKDGAVYPKAIKFINEGKEVNPFDGFEDLPIA